MPLYWDQIRWPHRVRSGAVSRAIGLLLIAAAAYGQVTASISGKVEDATGAPVEAAAITVKSTETGAVRSVKTDAAGMFRVPGLPLGPQEVKAEKSGFKAALRTGVNLEVGQDAAVNLRLEVGDFVQQVIVSEEVPLVNTTTSPVAGMVGERAVKDLPLNGRSIDSLLTLNPSAINYVLKSPQTSTSNGNTFSVAGRRPMDNMVLLNGIEYGGTSQLAVTPGGVSGDLLGIDAIREFNVLTHAYGAQYGKRAGAQVSLVTQSGTNAVHGTVFEFLRNSALDARNYFDQGSTPPFRRNQFGGSLGGPVKRDRLFLFGNYEGYRESLGVSSVSVVPDDQARLGRLPNATTGVYAPVANLNPGMLPYMSFWPQANGPELLTNGVASGTALSYNNPRQSIREDFGSVRADYNLRERDQLWFAYTVDDGNSLIPQVDPQFGSYQTLRNQVGSIQETHTFSPRVLNTFRFGFSRAGFNFDSFSLAQIPASLSFVAGGGPGGIVIGGGVTTTGVAAITAAGPNNAAGVWNRRNLFTYTDSVEISHGIHQISAGVWFQRLRDNENTASRRLGQATFASLTTFLQGTPTTFQLVPNPNALGWRSLFGAWYIEDAMRLRRNLTVQVGLRHEFTTGWNEQSGRAANYITDAQGVLVTTPTSGSSVFTENRAKKLFGPRVSAAWDVFGNGKMAVRAGFGTYYSMIDALSFLLNSLPPANGAISYANTPILNIIPIVPSVQVAPSCGPGVPTPCTTYAPQGIQADARTPAVQEWDLTIEREIDRNTAVRFAYVGSFGYHGLLSLDPNTISAQICGSPAGCTAGGTPGTTRSTVAQGAQYIPVQGRPNPYVSAGFFWFTEGNSSYNGLQAELIRRFHRGVELRANYTWSKNLDMNSGLTGAQANNQAQMILDRNDLRRDWGPSALNPVHQGSISARYELPLRGKYTGGWQVNGIAAMLSGFPFTPQIGSNRSGDGDTRNPDRPSLNPAFNGPVLLQTQRQWFDPNAFVLPAAGTYGDLGRGAYVGPGLFNVDLSVFKTLPVAERYRVQIRGEVFNAFNHTNLGTPNAVVFSGTNYSSSAGLITTTATKSRQIQFGLKLIF